MKYIITLLFFFFAINSFATVDYLCANDITKELYWTDSDYGTGIIGWRVLPENYEPVEKQLLANGYTFTTFPYKIEVLLILILITFIIAIKRRKRRGQKEETYC